MKNNEYWKRWWIAAGTRAIKTFAQSAIATIPVSVSIEEVAWFHVIGVAALASVLSLLTSVAGLPEVDMENEEDDYNW